MNFQATIHYLIKLRAGSKWWKPITKTLINQLVIELKRLPIIKHDLLSESNKIRMLV